MHWKFWLHGKRRRCVLGLDVGLTSCCLVVLSGSPTQPDMVCCAEQLQFPGDDWVTQGHVWRTEELGLWLRQHVHQGDYQVDGMYVCLDDACISQHVVTLPAELPDDDVTFQVLAEVQSMLGMSAADLSVDFGLDTTSKTSDSDENVRTRVYRAEAVSRFRVDALQRMAKAAGIKLCAVEGRSEAVRRTQTPESLGALPTVGVAMALQCEAAFGLALGAWGSRAFNFLPHRALADIALRQAWWLGVVACIVGGAFLATGFALVIAAATKVTVATLTNRAGVAEAYQSARVEHANAQALNELGVQQTQWLQTRRMLHQQTLQWVSVLDQSAPSVWVMRVDQQGTSWGLQGEALSFAHATQMLQQLKALAIWKKSPELSRLHLKALPSNMGSSVWQFHIQAELKGAG